MNDEQIDATKNVERMLNELKNHRSTNNSRRKYYDGKQRVKDLRLGSIPRGMRDMKSTIGWARLVVDVVAERLSLIGFTDDEQSGLYNVLRDLGNEEEISTAVSESLLYGVGFVSMSLTGDPAAPVVVVAENPNMTTVTIDRRTRMATEAITIDHWKGTAAIPEVRGWYHDSQYSVPFVTTASGVFHDAERETIEHGYGFVPVFPIVNRSASAGGMGRSEITDSIMGYVDSATRTVIEMEINRSLYANPRIVYRGTEKWMFMNADGTTKNIAAESQNSVVNLPARAEDESGGVPDVTVIPANSPSPFTEVLRAIAVQVSSEASIPVYRMNLAESNPTSAEAILASEIPLNARCDAKIKSLRPQIRNIARGLLSLLGVEDTELISRYSEPIFADPRTVTVTPDVTDLVQAGILSPNSNIVHQRIGLSPSESKRVEDENEAAAASAWFSNLTAQVAEESTAQAQRNAPEDNGNTETGTGS